MLEMKAVLAGDAPLSALREVRKAWFGALQDEVRAVKAEYEKTTATWQHKVTFLTKVKTSEREAYGEVWSDHRIYYFVHESISVMRAVLSPDWSPKTQPGVLSSGPGSGRKLYASKKIAKPPYEARKFTQEIIKVRQKPFQQAMEAATGEGLSRARVPRP